MIGKNRVFLLRISWLTEEDGHTFASIPISKNGDCKTGYVRSSIDVLEIKKPETQYLRGFPDCCLASMRGFEPPTYRLGGGRSILLSYMDVYEIGGFLGLPTSCLFFG